MSRTTNQSDDTKWEQFAELAQVFCLLIEDDSVRGRQGLKLIRRALLTLYSAAIELPRIQDDSAEILERIDHSEWSARFHAVMERIENENIYCDTFDPLEYPSGDPVTNLLADDLGDIWRDLKTGLLVLPNASIGQIWGARWHWRFNFESHWGAHAIGALRALHYILLQDM